MTEKSENEKTQIPKDKAASDAAEKRVEDMAGKAAQKASKTEQNYDKAHDIFSK
jgi:hypothetical protein